MSEIIDKLLSLGSQHGRTGEKLTVQGVLIHYVGNPQSSAMANRDYFENSGAGVSAHYIVGLNGEIIRCIPESERAQHAGKSYAAKYDTFAKTNNSAYLGIETCHSDSSGKFGEKTYSALVRLTAEICVRHRIELSKVLRHYDVTGKNCPLYYVNNEGEWVKFKSAVASMILTLLAKTPILSEKRYSAAKMADWAKSKGATGTFANLAKSFVTLAAERGVDAFIAYCQSAKETAFGRFGGVLDESFMNTCGMKVSAGGGDYDANAHKRFGNWDESIAAQLDHLALYAGAKGYPKAQTPDPRHFPTIRGSAPTVEELGGKWAGSLFYGRDIADMYHSAAAGIIDTKAAKTAEDKLADLIRGTSVNSPQYWLENLRNIKYFEGFVEIIWGKYEG